MKTVLDASALLPYLQEEPGGEAVDDVLHDALISAVNWSEVIQKADSRGVPIAGMREELLALGLTIEPFTGDRAGGAGRLWKKTVKQGLSLGDRACLSLGMELKAPILTTNKVWKKLKLGVDIKVIR